MTDPTALSGPETFWLGALILLFSVDLIGFYRSPDRLAIYQPPVFVMAFMSYYCLVGPIQRLLSNNWIDRLTDFRSAAVLGWAGAVVFYVAFRVGYSLLRGCVPRKRFSLPFDAMRAGSLGGLLCWIGFLLYFLANGFRTLALLNPFAVVDSPLLGFGGLDLGPFANYADSAINLLIPGVLLIFAGWVKRRHSPLGWVFWMALSIALFTSLGFRWRIVTLVVPLALLWYLARGRRPSLPVILVSLFGLLLYAGFVGVTRTYGLGLDLAAPQSFEVGDLLTAGLDESSIFLTTAGIIDNAPANQPFVGLSPLISTLLFPIPSAFLEQKDSANYLFDALARLYGVESLGFGAAILNYAEYYLMFGWFSLIAMGVLFGGLLRVLWNWFSIRRGEAFAQVAYLATAGLLYVWISRGYLPQVALTFAFGSLPLFWLYYRQAVRPVVLSMPVQAASGASAQP